MSACLFCRIATREIPADEVLRTDDFVAFRDLDPKAPTHVLVIPVRHFDNVSELVAADADLAGRLLGTATEVAGSTGVADAGYRVVLNTGPEGGQSVFHVHAHVLGGRHMGWPPG
jgi:histidine triad (HIT) family protein